MPYAIRTKSGNPFVYGNLLSGISIEDIAHHLSNIGRFCGATDEYFCVAEHSVGVCKVVEAMGGNAQEQIAALLHDGHESVMNDAPTPFQRWFADEVCEGEDFLETAKTRLDEQIFRNLGISHYFTPNARAMIKIADKIAFIVEAETLFEDTPEWVTEHLQKAQDDLNIPTDEVLRLKSIYRKALQCLDPLSAEHLFLETFRKLENEQLHAKVA